MSSTHKTSFDTNQFNFILRYGGGGGERETVEQHQCRTTEARVDTEHGGVR